MKDVAIVGAASTRFGMFTELRLRDLASEAADRALADAGFEPEEVGLVVFGNAAAGILTGQEMIRAQVNLGPSRLAGRPTVAVENACASSSSAFYLACMAVASGAHEVVVVIGAEKMTNEDRTLAGRALATAIDVERRGSAPKAAKPSSEAAAAKPRPVFMEIYAAAARAYMERSGATAADFAVVAAKNTSNGSLNPIAQSRKALSVEEVLAERTIVAPLTRPMCSSIGDGAAALVLCRPELARRRGLQAVRVLAAVLGSGRPDDDGKLVVRTAKQAYERAGIGPSDLNAVELHDAAAPAELVLYEELGLAPPGDGPKLLREGATLLGGRLPVNPSGGLLARGHPIGATGAAQLVELFDQLRGRAGQRQIPGARIALAENAGGELGGGPAACMVSILAAS